MENNSSDGLIYSCKKKTSDLIKYFAEMWQDLGNLIEK
jgi:hypothetical protein